MNIEEPQTAVVYGYTSPLNREPICVLSVCDEKGLGKMNIEAERRKKIGYKTFVLVTECEYDLSGNAFASLVVNADRTYGKHGYEWSSIDVKSSTEWEFCRQNSKASHQYTLPYYIPVGKPKL